MNASHEDRLARTRCSLQGLSVGDALGDRFFIPEDEFERRVEARVLPPAPWPYSDDTQMALSIYAILYQYREINQDNLAESFADRYEPGRGYGPSMQFQLRSIRNGRHWKVAAMSQFEGQGSFGNGAAMRVAPLGAYFADSIEQVVEQSVRSAEVTHAHMEGIAGAVAIALAAAWACRLRELAELPSSTNFIDLIVPHVPQSEVRMKLLRARDISPDSDVATAAGLLGNGAHISAQDTVGFAIWCAGRYLDSYEEAIWQTISVGGDVDTNCAIVGGIVSCYSGIESIPLIWLEAREPLPQWAL